MRTRTSSLKPALLAALAGLPVLCLGLLACGPRVVVPASPPVRVPPAIDLAQLEQIGVVQFRAPQGAALGDLATQRFVESARRDQGLVRMVDLGESPAPDDDLTLARERGVRTVLAGDLTVSRVRPRVRVASDLGSGSVSMSVEATLAVRLIEVESGASIWSRTASATRPVGSVGLFGGDGVVVDAGPAQEAYGAMVDELVERVTGDFHERWERR